MKTKDLRELVDNLRESNYMDNDLKKLFKLSSEEFQNVLVLSRNSIEKCKVLLNYYCYCIENPEIEELLENHLEITNARDVIAQMIIEANDKDAAEALFQTFDGSNVMDIRLFRNQKEYFYCLNVLKTYDESCVDEILEIINYILGNTIVRRMEILEQLFNYIQNFDCDFEELLKHLKNRKVEEDILEAFDFLQLGYDLESCFSVLEKWSDEDDFENENENAIRNARDFLKAFPYAYVLSDLPNVFLVDYSNYDDIIRTIDMIQTSVEKPIVMIQIYIDTPIQTEENLKLLNEKTQKVLGTKNSRLISLFFDLLKSSYIRDNIFLNLEDPEEQRNRLDQIITTFQNENLEEERMEVMKELLVHLPYPMWVQIPADANLDTLNLFWHDYLFYLTQHIFSLNDERSYSIIEKISRLSRTSLEKITWLLKNNVTFWNDFNGPKHDELMNILFEKETESSLDYILGEYKKVNDLKNKATGSNLSSDDDKVELKFVSDLLEAYPIEDILDGFDDEEEITEKTLIRSLKYKNNQS